MIDMSGLAGQAGTGGRLNRRALAVLVPIGLVSALMAGLVVMSLGGADLWFYWEAGRRFPDIYGWSAAWSPNAIFRYPPSTALLFVPLAQVPLVALRVAWLAADLLALRWGLRSWRLAAVAACLPPVAVELAAGNVNLFAAVLLVRAPAGLAILAGLAPKPMFAWLSLLDWRRAAPLGIGAVLVAAGVSLAIDGSAYLAVLARTADTELGELTPLRWGWAYPVWAGACLLLAYRLRASRSAASVLVVLASPMVQLSYFALPCVALVAEASKARRIAPSTWASDLSAAPVCAPEGEAVPG